MRECHILGVYISVYWHFFSAYLHPEHHVGPLLSASAIVFAAWYFSVVPRATNALKKLIDGTAYGTSPRCH